MPKDWRARFAATMAPRPAQVKLDDRPALRRQCETRLGELAKMEPLSGLDLGGLLREHGIGRRSFLGWASATTAALMLPPAFEPLVAKAAELVNRIPVLWIEGQSCRGNSEALLRSAGPTIDDLLLNVISLQFHQLLMAGAGFQAERQKQQAARAFAGRYVLVVEGSIPTGLGGAYSTTGASGTTILDEVKELSAGAAVVIAIGACATYAALPAARPDPTGAVSVADVVKGTPVINIPACPANAVNFAGTLVNYTLTGTVPDLDSQLRPKWAFGNRVHDNCERRAHFDAGQFVQRWGDEGAQNNYCLYKMGCKGPMTYNNCPLVRYNEGTSWPVRAGHGCIGCSQPGFWDTYATERPLAEGGATIPGLFGLGVDGSVDKIGLGLLAATAVGIGAHAVGSAIANGRGKRQRVAVASAAAGPPPGGPAHPGPRHSGPPAAGGHAPSEPKD